MLKKPTLNPECKRLFIEQALHNARSNPKKRLPDFWKSLFVSDSFLMVSRRFSVYSLYVFSLSKSNSSISVGKGDSQFYGKDLEFVLVSAKNQFSHERAMDLIRTMKPPTVVLGLLPDLVTSTELEQYADVLQETGSRLCLILEDESNHELFLPFVNKLSNQIVFIDCESKLLASSARMSMNLCICHNPSRSQIRQVLSHDVTKMVMNFNRRQTEEEVQSDLDSTQSTCESLRLLSINYRDDPENLLPALINIKMFCPNLKTIHIHADFESDNFIDSFDEEYFVKLNTHIGLSTQIVDYATVYELPIVVKCNSISHLSPESTIDMDEFLQLAPFQNFHNHTVETRDYYKIHALRMKSKSALIQFTLKIVQYDPKPMFFVHKYRQVKQFFSQMYHTFF